MLTDGSGGEALVPANPGQEDVTGLVSLNASSAIRQILQDEDFMDCLAVAVQNMTKTVKEAQDAVRDAVQDFHNGGAKYWRAELAADADLSTVLERAANTIDAIDGDEADALIDKLKEVLSKCDDFIGKATFYGSVMPRVLDFKSFVDAVRVMAKRCKALSCESLLAFAHNSCKSVEWQARLIRNQLTEIMIGNIDEKDLHQVLLKSSKSLVEKAGKQAREEDDHGQTKATAASAESARKKLRLGK
ncbi:unnamed protein product [Symbiodinium sp. KB8]|nr:unnamed protein product [Symbiodinium sp. KB8]